MSHVNIFWKIQIVIKLLFSRSLLERTGIHLSVVPDANKCFQEISRVLKYEGKIIIFDKFAPKNKNLSLIKVLLRPIIEVLGTDIGRSFEELISNKKIIIKVEEDTPLMMNGMYRKIVISKVL